MTDFEDAKSNIIGKIIKSGINDSGFWFEAELTPEFIESEKKRERGELMDIKEIPNQELHRIATTAIIFRSDSRVLITKRSPHKKVWPGRWTVPGGGLETDDYTTRPPTHTGFTNQWYNALDYSIRREVAEETGLGITDPWFVCDLTFIRPDGIPVLVLSYAANLLVTNSNPYLPLAPNDAKHYGKYRCTFCGAYPGSVEWDKDCFGEYKESSKMRSWAREKWEMEVSNSILLDADATEYAWVNLDEAKNYDLIDGIYHELELAFTSRSNRRKNDDT